MATESISSYLSIIEKNNGPVIFRGHSDIDWKLVPTIARLNPKKSPIKLSNGWQGLEEVLLNDFKKHASLYLSREPKSKLEWMIQAQHHGLPTRLLDWTTNPLKALFFAVENTAHHDIDGKVFVFFPRMWSENPEGLDIEKSNCVDVFYPINISNRVRAQEGCFVLFPQKNNFECHEPLNEGFSQSCAVSISSIIIEKKYKKQLIKQLDQLGVNDMTMFPDLDGVSKSIRRKFQKD